jgi:hypothetical protein
MSPGFFICFVRITTIATLSEANVQSNEPFSSNTFGKQTSANSFLLRNFEKLFQQH